VAGVAVATAFAVAAPAQAALPGVPDPAAAAQQTVGQAQQQVEGLASQTSATVPAAKPVENTVKTVDTTVNQTVDKTVDTVRKVAPAPAAPKSEPPAPAPSSHSQPPSTSPTTPSSGDKPDGRVLGTVRQHVHRHHPAAHAPVAAKPVDDFQATSARPPAAEVGGRPVSPPPRMAPAPVAGGATALPFSSSSAGGFFVPFLALLVLAALAMPRLLRRLDGPPAFVRPEPFLCALERPG
jgi:hypothetical protein